MRLSLGLPIEKQRADAIKRVTHLARAAHAAHEDAGGVAFSAVALAADDEHTKASRERHLYIQNVRHAVIDRIKDAPHGKAIAGIISEFAATFELNENDI